MYFALAMTARYLDSTASARTQATADAEPAGRDKQLQTSRHGWRPLLHRSAQQAGRHAANAIRPGGGV